MADPVSTASVIDISRVPFTQRMTELEFVAECILKSDAARQPYVETWQEMLENYLVTTPGDGPYPRLGAPIIAAAGLVRQRGRVQRRRAHLKDPETHQIIESLSAQGVGLLLGSKDYMTADPVGRDDPEKSRYIARILMGVLSQPGVFRTFYQIFKDAFIFGTAIVELGWETLSRQQIIRVPLMSAEGFQVGEDFVPGEVVYRNRPLFRMIDIFDFYPDPSGTRIQEDMLYVGKRFRIPAHKALAMAQAGIYDKEGVTRAVMSGGSNDGDNKGDNERFETMQRQGRQATNPSYKMLTGFEFYAQVPYKPSDGARNRVITCIEGQWVRSHINPYIDGNFPMKEVVVNPLAGRFWGLSPAEVVRYIQDSTDSLLMVMNDTAALSANNVLLAGATFGGDPNRLARRGPNDVIQCQDVNAIKPLEIDTNALTFAGNELLRRKMQMREASGATNPLQSIPTSDRQTATEVSELVRLASQKVELMVNLIERDDMPWIGRTLHERLKQFLPRDAEIQLAGEEFPFTVDDIDVDADVRFVGSRHAQSQLQKVASLRESIGMLAQTLGAGPHLMMMFPQLYKRLFEALEQADAESIVEQATQMAQQLQQAQEQQQAAEVQAKGVTPAPNQRAPETFGTQAGQTEQQGQRVA